jgi:hypothetical protein
MSVLFEIENICIQAVFVKIKSFKKLFLQGIHHQGLCEPRDMQEK